MLKCADCMRHLQKLQCYFVINGHCKQTYAARPAVMLQPDIVYKNTQQMEWFHTVIAGVYSTSTDIPISLSAMMITTNITVMQNSSFINDIIKANIEQVLSACTVATCKP